MENNQAREYNLPQVIKEAKYQPDHSTAVGSGGASALIWAGGSVLQQAR